MADEKRKKPYVFVTWLCELLSGEAQCWWAAWKQAHFKVEEIGEGEESERKLQAWREDHDKMVASLAKQARESGYEVKVEREAEWMIRSPRGDLSGKPDVVALKGKTAKVLDAKSGKRKTAHLWQVRIYIYALMRTWLVGVEIAGRLLYKTGVSAVDYDPAEHDPQIEAAMRRVISDVEPEHTPSRSECRFCKIASCTKRITDDPTHTVNTEAW